MNDEQLKALRFWRVAIQYLHLAQSCAVECSNSENRMVVVSDEEIDMELFNLKTKWSDFNIAIPVLFNFYHGIEVLLKGFLAVGGFEMPKNHKLSTLFSVFIEKYPTSGLITILEKYLNIDTAPILLKGFFSDEDKPIDLYYQSLKYPESVKGDSFEHLKLLYKGANGAAFYKELASDIETIRKIAVSEGRHSLE